MQLSNIKRLSNEGWYTLARLSVSDDLFIELAAQDHRKYVIAFDWRDDETDFTWLGHRDEFRATAFFIRAVTRYMEGEFGADLLTIVRGEAA